MAIDLEPPWVDTRYGSVCYGPRGVPALTIGPQMIEWGMSWLTIPDGELAGQPWVPTPEQARFICWFHALDSVAARRRRARWVYRRAALRRLKGGGKDPLAAYLGIQHLVGPSVPVWDAQQGRFIGVPHKAPWVQIAAVSSTQTQNTTSLFPGMLPERTRRKFRLTVAQTMIQAPRGRIVSLTSNPLSAEGPRPNLGIVNEPQNWFKSNGGHALYAVMRRNAAKVGGRLLEIGNAPENGAGSVSERTERAYNAWRAGKTTGDIRLLYDSREAPPESRLDDLVLRRAGLRAAAGDAWWIDPEDIDTEIGSPDITPSESRRFYFNRSVAADDAWIDPNDWDRLGTGFSIPPGREVVIFADLSKSRDATAVMVCDLENGHVATIDVWERPTDHRREHWQVPRTEVLRAGLAAMSRWHVCALFADPGSGEDDEGKKYWDAVLDAWARQLDADAMPATPSGALPHRVRWDMRNPNHVRQFTAASERTATDIEDRLFSHDNHPLLNAHAYNSKLRPNEYGVSMGKEHNDSPLYVDAAVAAVGARMVRIQYQEWRRTHRRSKRAGNVTGVRTG